MIIKFINYKILYMVDDSMVLKRSGNDEDSFVQKIDVLDLLINVIKEHEERLDILVTRLEAVAHDV